MSDSAVPVPDDFKVQRFIGRGCYSVVYEVLKLNGPDHGSKYALKRFFLENDSSVKCVLRERRILERLALADFQSPFLPMLCYSMWHNFASAFVLREGSGCDLYDLLCHVGNLSETHTRFYVAEVICGLEHLHSLDIVHLDVKPENILFYPDGHIFVSDLDRSFDTSLGTTPSLDDFTGTPLFMAPEIARGERIDFRADVWSLGVLTAEMTTGPIRSEAKNTAEDFKRARLGSYSIRGLKRLSKPLQSFFSACLQREINQRPSLKGVKELRFLKHVDWEKAKSRQLRPPHLVSDLRHRAAKVDRTPIVSTDIRLLKGAFSPLRPVHFDSSHKLKDASKHNSTEPGIDTSHLTPTLIRDGYTLEKLDNMFKSFGFVHPTIKVEMIVSDINSLQISPEPTQLQMDTKEIMHMDSGQVVPECPPLQSLFRRSRTRGISIGD